MVGCVALHGVEASLLASDSERELRSSICSVVWSRRQPMANVGAVLCVLDGPTGCDPAFCVVWFRFRVLRRYLALGPLRFLGFIVFLEMVVMVQFIFCLPVLLRLVFGGTLILWLGLDLGYLCFAFWVVLFSILRLLFWMPGVTRFSFDL